MSPTPCHMRARISGWPGSSAHGGRSCRPRLPGRVGPAPAGHWALAATACQSPSPNLNPRRTRNPRRSRATVPGPAGGTESAGTPVQDSRDSESGLCADGAASIATMFPAGPKAQAGRLGCQRFGIPRTAALAPVFKFVMMTRT